jgi:hypothetical protein
MPGTPRPVVDPRFGPAWTPIVQNAQATKQQAAALAGGAQSTNIVDQYGNTVVIMGQLDQIIIIGASFMQPGVQVQATLSFCNAGMLGQLAGEPFTYSSGLLSVTQGATSATASTNNGFGGGVEGGMVIGAANVSDPSTGIATPAITPGTTVTGVTGSGPWTIGLSEPAAETGTDIYWAACFWLTPFA